MSRQGIMLCYPYEEKRLKTWRSPYIIQPKLNGERCRVLLREKPIMLSSEENEIISCPHILSELETLVKLHPELIGLELDGENYIHDKPLQDIHSIVSRKTGALHDDYEEVKLHLFDLVADAPQSMRLDALKRMFDLVGGWEHIVRVPFWYTSSTEEIDGYLNKFMEQGFEGFIVRDANAHYVRRRSTQMMKFKPRKSDVYQIIGLQEELSIHRMPKGTLGAFVLRGTDGTIFNVGTGFTQEQRKQYWDEKLIGKWAKVLYQNKSKTGVPCHTVFVSIMEQPVTEDDVEVPDIWK